MSEEEIHKALEIIGQPITVNCKEYHYFDQENYDKLVAVYNNCLWFIRNFEQINATVERVQQENKILRENAEHNDKVVDKVNWENRLFKEVIDEVREYINSYDVFKEFSFPLMKRDEENQTKSSIKYEFDTSIKKELLQILDRVIGDQKC